MRDRYYIWFVLSIILGLSSAMVGAECGIQLGGGHWFEAIATGIMMLGLYCLFLVCLWRTDI